MRFIKNVLSQLHVYITWLLLSAVLWGWIFTFVTDAPAEKKIVLYGDVAACRDTELDLALEETKPEGIRMIRCRTFQYAMFDETSLLTADLYIVRASRMEESIESFRPYPAGTFPLEGAELWEREGLVYGCRIYDAAALSGAGEEYITYFAPGEPEEDCYLCFGIASLHLTPSEGGDGAAEAVARRLLELK